MNEKLTITALRAVINQLDEMERVLEDRRDNSPEVIKMTRFVFANCVRERLDACHLMLEALEAKETELTLEIFKTFSAEITNRLFLHSVSRELAISDLMPNLRRAVNAQLEFLMGEAPHDHTNR